MKYLVTLLSLFICVLSTSNTKETYDLASTSKFISMDSEYADIDIHTMILLKKRAAVRMIDDGWTSDNYVLHEMDCEDFALRLKTEMTKIASEMGILKGKALAAGLFGYQKDLGGGHAVVFVICDGRLFFFEPYPNQNFPIKLSKSEISGAMIKIF